MKIRFSRAEFLALVAALTLTGCGIKTKDVIETVPKIIPLQQQRTLCYDACPQTPLQADTLCQLACDRAVCLACGRISPGETIACWQDNNIFKLCCVAGTPDPGVDPRGYCSSEPTDVPTEAPPRPQPRASATSTATSTATAAPTPTATPGLQPPPFALINGGSGVDGQGRPSFTEVKPQQHLIRIDFTWWFYMGEEWRDRYACGGPNNNSSPCWPGGINSPCDPDHPLAFNGPCHGREWGPKPPGTIVTMTGPGYVPGSLASDDKNPFADIWFKYNPNLPVHARYCPPADMTDVSTGLVIPIKGWFSASGCREVDFVTPKE